MKPLFLTGLLLIAALLAPFSSGHASEPLFFSPVSSLRPAEKLALGDFLRSNGYSDYETGQYAKADLNADSLFELVLAEATCKIGSGQCQYLVLGETDGSYAVLARIPAVKLTLSNALHEGTRAFSAQETMENDFVSRLYIWNAQTSRFEAEK